MYRKLSTSILIALMLLILMPFITYASPSETMEDVTIFVAKFDAESNQFYGAYNTPDGAWHAIAWENTNGDQSRRSDIAVDSNGMAIVLWDMADDTYTFLSNRVDYTWRYLDDSDIGTIANVNEHDGILDGTVNGDYAQFTSGYAINGPMFLLREADPFTAGDARGWMVQNGNLISYVAGNGESPVKHTIVLPLVLH